MHEILKYILLYKMLSIYPLFCLMRVFFCSHISFHHSIVCSLFKATSFNIPLNLSLPKALHSVSSNFYLNLSCYWIFLQTTVSRPSFWVHRPRNSPCSTLKHMNCLELCFFGLLSSNISQAVNSALPQASSCYIF